MRTLLSLLSNFSQAASTWRMLLVDTLHFLRLCLRSPTALAAENLFLRKQLALYQERHVKPRRPTAATRPAVVWLARWFDWRQALAVVQPDAFLRWHRQGFRLFWRWKSTPGRPPIPAALQAAEHVFDIRRSIAGQFAPSAALSQVSPRPPRLGPWLVPAPFSAQCRPPAHLAIVAV